MASAAPGETELHWGKNGRYQDQYGRDVTPDMAGSIRTPDNTGMRDTLFYTPPPDVQAPPEPKPRPSAPQSATPPPMAGLEASAPMPTATAPFPAPSPMQAPPDVPATAAPQAMAGLQAAAPEGPPPPGLNQRLSRGALNPRLGQRNPPDGLSGLKVLTY